MPLTIITDDMRRKAGTKRIRFIRNTCEQGVDYGPDYPSQIAVVPAHRADYYIYAGRAVEADSGATDTAPEAPRGDESLQAQTPATHRTERQPPKPRG